MAKVKNQHFYSESSDELNRLAADFTFIGRETQIENGHLTVLALPSTWKRKKKNENRVSMARDRKNGWDDPAEED